VDNHSSLNQLSLSGNILQCLCEITVIYVLALQGVGLVNLAAGSPLFSEAGVLLTTGAVIAGWWLWRRPRFFIGNLPAVPFRFCCLVLACTYALLLADALTSYPNGYDAVAYHLLKPVTWLRPVPAPLSGTKWQMALPANAELFALPAIALNRQSFVVVGNVGATAILALSVYLLGRRFSGSATGGVLSAAIVISTPIIIFQTFAADVDAFGAAFLAAALALFFSFEDSGRNGTFVLAALCAGVSIGTKQTFVPYAAVLLAFMLAVILKKRRFSLILPLLIGALAPSVLWLCRNAVSTGNPFYPYGLRIGFVALQPAADMVLLKLNPDVSWGVTRRLPGPGVSEFFGIGAAFSTFAAAGAVALILETFRRKRLALFFLTGVLLSFGGFWWMFIHITRFALTLLVAVAVASALLCRYFSGKQLVAVNALLTVGVTFSCLACLSVQINRVANRIHTRDWSRAAYYGYPPLIDRLPPGTVIVDTSHDRNLGFQLAGRDLRNRVLTPGSRLTDADLEHPVFEYAVKQGAVDAEERSLRQSCDLVYDGTPVGIFRKTTVAWRIYRVRNFQGSGHSPAPNRLSAAHLR
jgi:hypothetical protein